MRTTTTVLVLLLVACSHKSDTPQNGAGKRGTAGGGPVEYPVDVAPLVTRKMQYTVSAPGSLDSFQTVQITAAVSGICDRVAFKEGQDVKAGEVLATIESERYGLALEQAKTAVEKAQAALKSAQAALDRRLEAQKESPGVVAGEEIEQKQTAVDSAKADLDAAKEAQKVAALNLRDSSVRTPIEGIVQTRTVQQGQFLQTGAVLATIIQRDPMLLRFQVTEEDARRLQTGMPCSLQLKESTLTYTAKITLVAGAADPTTRMVPVTAQLDPTEHQYSLRPGAFCSVTVPIGTARPGIVVPSLAVQPTERGNVIYVVDDKHIAHQEIVRVGMHTADGSLELASGATAGQLMVVRGVDPLSDGAPVKVQSTTTLEAAENEAAAQAAAAAGSGSGSGTGSSSSSVGSGSGR
ncbi:MAG TPA: efflux RND transporter periplasmic adaptor subunit [Kofleriaceae bacterium]|nr:efflux RND transporter periplasmic adaptor subunit [Kofleriaceae bacterium]